MPEKKIPKTEMRNKNTTHIDKMSTIDMLYCIQKENENSVKAIYPAMKDIEKACDCIAERMSKGGRLIYVGAGTSGRLGILDASECPPTYGVSHEMVVGLIAGGKNSMFRAAEGAEDNAENGKNDLININLNKNDSVVGISAAGGAAYVCGALQYANETGALSVSLSSNEDAKIAQIASISIFTDTGAEVVTGSTRMKAGNAQKFVLNMISTVVMIKLGKVYENMMINLRPTNIKLKERMIRILMDIIKVDYNEALSLLEENKFDIRTAADAWKAKQNKGQTSLT